MNPSIFFSRPSPKAGRELQTELDRMMEDEAGTLSKKSAGAGHRAVSLHRDCVLVLKTQHHRNEAFAPPRLAGLDKEHCIIISRAQVGLIYE